MKRRSLASFCVGLAAATGCGEPIAPFNGVYDFQALVETGDTVRSAVVHVPPAYNGSRAFPLLLAFHGFGRSGEELQQVTGFDSVADRLSFIVAYPDAAPSWDARSPDDLQFTRDLIDYLSGRLGIAPGRIYAAGVSAGAWSAMGLACEEADRFAAVGIVAATMYEDQVAPCKPSMPITTALVVGTDDYVVPFDGAFGRLSADSTIGVFAQRNGCDASGRTVVYEPDTYDDGRRVRREAYKGCLDGTETVLWVVEGGGHEWYRGDVDTGTFLAELFLRHHR